MTSLEFDARVNAMYIRLGKGKVACSEPLEDNVFLDVDEKGEPLGLELLLPKGMKPEVKAKFLKAV
jgi:uncharacterized protein YuzE